jgi:membrane peptidoglycan carboxypeptidase
MKHLRHSNEQHSHKFQSSKSQFNRQTDDVVDIEINSAEMEKPNQSRFSKLGAILKALFFSKKTRIIIGGIFGLGFILGAAAIAYLWVTTPSIDTLVQQNQSSIVYGRDGKTEIFKFFDEEKRKVVPINEIPRQMQLAMIGLEQENFWKDQQGIPWRNLAGATIKCFTTRSECRGASGLSQQFIKNYTNDEDRTISRKVRELITSIKLNQEKSKQEVLELYLNEVPFGRNAYGVEEAAKSYFGGTPGLGDKPVEGVKDITIIQACYLASFPQRTTFFAKAIDPNGKPLKESNNWKELEYRKNICLEKQLNVELEGPGTDKLIKTQEELELLKKTEISFAPLGTETRYGHFRDFVTQELDRIGISDSDLKTRGYKIVTSLDPAVQDSVEKTLLADTARINKMNADNAAAIVLDGPTGQIIAMAGSLDYNNAAIDGQFNVALSPQQPGSSIKPYEYAAALEKDFNPGTVVQDIATEFQSGFTPTNFNRSSYRGAITLRSGLQNSYNTPAVKAAYLAVGGSNETPTPQQATKALFDFTDKVGVKFPVNEKCGLASTIGACELTMLSHAGGINTFAQEGKYLTPTPFISIIDLKTNTDMYANLQTSENPAYPVADQAVDPLVARQMNQIMSDYEARYPAFCNGRGRCDLAINLELADRKVAAKTGTTDESRDTWTVGYTPQYTVTTWVGRNDNEPLAGVGAASAAAPLWKSIIKNIHEGKEAKEFSTQGLILTKLNSRTGLLDENGYNEWLTPKQINVLKTAGEKLNSGSFNPLESNIFTNRTSIVSRKVKINKIDGKLAVDGKTLPENIEEKVVVQCISEFPQSKAWARNSGCKSEDVPSETSQQDQVSEQQNKPVISTNLQADEIAPAIIKIDAKTTGSSSDKKITLIELYIDGKSVATSQNDTLSFDPSKIEDGKKTVLIRVVDNYGTKDEISFSNVEFTKKKESDNPVEDAGNIGDRIVDRIQDLLNNQNP